MITPPYIWKLRAVRRLDQRNSGCIHLTHLVERLEPLGEGERWFEKDENES
jgi:hypothetical protein